MTHDDRPADGPRRRAVLKAVAAGAALPAGLAAPGAAATDAAADGDAAMSSARAEWYGARRVVRDEQCMYPSEGPLVGEAHDFELYGPTPINAQSANGSLAVALDRAGTVTVFRWPHPSFYDQVKYKTSDRTAPRFGAYENAGAFLGLVLVGDDGETETTWLRDWDHEQRYVHDTADAVETTYRDRERGLTVTVTDLVVTDDDAFVRDVTVRRRGDSPVADARLVAFENLNLVASKKPKFPTRGWCEEESNRDRARYDATRDAVVHDLAAVDASTGNPTSVAVAMGFAGPSDGHQVGGDAYESTASPAGQGGPTQDAYDDAADGELRGNDEFVGQTTGALVADLTFEGPSGGRASERVVFAAGADADAAGGTLESYRGPGMPSLVAAKRRWIEDLLADAPLPDPADESPADREAVLSVAKRALVTLVTTFDPTSGAVVASVATQAPYGEDWIRDGAFFNYALDLVGRHESVAQRNRWYAGLQQRADDPHPTYPDVPPGNWPMNHYADGVAGGPIPWEIDETGYGLWTLWDHYDVTGDEAYLRDVWHAIERGADWLVECRDPRNGLQCYASEDDHPEPTQTITGAATVWLGLDSAVRAAEVLGEDASRYRARREELASAIETLLYDEDRGFYGARRGFPMAPLAWPACYHPFDDSKMESHLDAVWRAIAPTFDEPEAGAKRSGLYEAKGLIPLAMARRESGPGSLADVREGVKWIATRHATDDTRVMGEIWFVEDGEVKTTVSQPHVWEQTLFYLAALEAYPPAEVADAAPDCGGVLELLRERNAPDDG